MFKIINNEIYLTRGDDGYVLVRIKNTDGSTYTMESGDSLCLTVKSSPNQSIAIFSIENSGFEAISKVENNNTVYLYRAKIESSYTKGLPFGDYVYDVQLTLSGGDKNTIIPCSAFHVCKEVT